MNENSYKIFDYGEGKNLCYSCKYSKKINYQIGNWVLYGTPKYMDPINFKAFMGYKLDREFNQVKEYY